MFWGIIFSNKKNMLKILKRSWEPFRSCLLNITANPANFHQNWAGLQPPLIIHASHQYLEEIHWFEAILKMFDWPFLRPLRSKDFLWWILRLRPLKFVIISERLAANLEEVKQSSVWLTVPKFWFIWLWFLSFCITYRNKSLKKSICW